MEWTLPEFFQFLRDDPELRVLFVEGDHDLSFWRALVPLSDRTNTAVYKIASVNVTGVVRSERGCIMELARQMFGGEFADRVKFFADADHDRILGRVGPATVILTDSRDRESYVMSHEGMASVCETGFNKTEEFTRDTVALVRTILRPVAALRVLSERLDKRLPFKRTLNPEGEPGRIRKYFEKKNGVVELKCDGLIVALIQNSQLNMSEKGEITAALLDESVRLQDFDDDQIIHGKDLIGFLSWRLGCSFEAAQACVNLALLQLRQVLIARPNMQLAANWVRG